MVPDVGVEVRTAAASLRGGCQRGSYRAHRLDHTLCPPANWCGLPPGELVDCEECVRQGDGV